MKAAVFKAPGAPLVIEDVPDPTPGPGEMILKVHASGICGTDLHWSECRDHAVGWRVLAPGAVMGHEFAGEVVELGSDLRNQWRIGERVCSQPFISCGRCEACLSGHGYRCDQVITRASPALTGAYAEYARIGAHSTIRLPEPVSYREGALVEPLAVGLNAVAKARLEPGDTVLIVGAGPVGISVAMWCRFFGARHVVVSDLLAERAERATAFGATAAIDASKEEVSESLVRLTGGPARVVFDCVGVPGSLQSAIDCAPCDGHVVVVGLCMAADRVFPAKAITKELELTFVYVYRKQDFEIVVDLLGRKRVDVGHLVTACVGFDRFSEMFEDLKKPGDQIKVMLEPHGHS